jgi:succinyl-diaminopimelate desuccinylase
VTLDVTLPAADLTAAVVDVESVSGNERALADAVETVLRGCAHLDVTRDGDAVVARTSLDRDRRVLLGGHLDTVPVAGNLPSRRDGDRLYGCGTSDMKSAVAVMLRLAVMLDAPRHDVTYVFYDNEEVEAERNGLGRLARNASDLLDADLAILMEPTNGAVEAGCQGTLRAHVTVPGVRAHSARAWLGDNAIHRAGALLDRLVAYVPREPDIDGCRYHEGLNAVAISGGVAGNVVPDACTVTVNFRFAPDRTEAQAADHVREVLAPYDVVIADSAPGALPGLDSAAAKDFVAAVGTAPLAKLGWTDVARFAALRIPALNYGPGDPNLAHRADESVDVALIDACEATLRAYLG